MGKTYSENNNILELKSISNIHNEKFIIPSFQRGYRWEPVQVITLLEDIKEYIEKKLDTFMCLQPVVFYKKNNNDNKLEELVVVDGQQRLTTIAVISRCLGLDNINIEYNKNNKALQDILNNVESYLNTNNMDINNLFNDDNKLLFEKTSEIYKKIFLSAKNNSDKVNLLDEYYIILSYLTIKCWLENEKNKNINIEESIKNLFKSDEDNFSIKFIWYDVTGEINGDETKAINIFTRLNIGKIELTDAELIKALFLKKDNFKDSELDKKLHIAYKWDEIEKTLNNDSFWYFLSNDKDKPKKDRIELVLELAANIKNDGQHNLFRDYENKLKNKNELDKHWQAVEECFMTLKEWYNDNEMYHYIGSLLNNKLESLENIYTNKLESLDNTYKRDIIKNKVIEKIKTKINVDEVENYTYYNNEKQIKLILFFSNIYETIHSNQARNKKGSVTETITNRFPFDLYIKEDFDVEHIAPQTENPLNNKEDRIKWFKDSYEYLEKIDFSNINDDEIKNNLTEENIKKIIENEDNKNINNIIFNNEKWNIIYNYIIETAIEKGKNINLEDEEHCLGNLVLLPSDINRAYKNALFGVKRKYIIDKETEKYRFIPVVTRHAFLKYYSKNIIDLWTKKDAEQFKKTIINNLNKFLGINKEAQL